MTDAGRTASGVFRGRERRRASCASRPGTARRRSCRATSSSSDLADAGLDEAAYATKVEDAFIAERGTPFLLSAKDWTLIRGWREGGRPRRHRRSRRARGVREAARPRTGREDLVDRVLRGRRRGAVGDGAAGPRRQGRPSPPWRARTRPRREEVSCFAFGCDCARRVGSPRRARAMKIFLEGLREKAAAKIDAIPREGPFEESERRPFRRSRLHS